MCTENIPAINSTIAVSSCPVTVSYMVYVSLPRGTKFGAKLPHSLKNAQPLTSVPPKP